MQAYILAGIVLNLLIELDRVFLQLGDVGIAIDRVHAAGRMPCRPGGQLGTLEQHDIRPAEFRQVIEDAGPDDAAADDRNPAM